MLHTIDNYAVSSHVFLILMSFMKDSVNIAISRTRVSVRRRWVTVLAVVPQKPHIFCQNLADCVFCIPADLTISELIYYS